jgi:two-component system chemotaxis response regulator CheB
VPILVTQHLPPAFMTVFARQLGVVAKRPAVVAEDGMKLTPDTLFIAPGDAHLTVSEERGERVVRLVHFPAASGCMPSVDPMLASVGAVAGRRGLGIVLTGMGRALDPVAAKMVACGGSVLAQDEASSAVWGMPRAIAEAGLAAAVLPPDQLARRVISRIGEH